MARPMPVLPEVGSMSVVFPGVISPLRNKSCQQKKLNRNNDDDDLFSASAIMLNAIRSFTELHGSMLSSFTIISASEPVVTFFSFRSGVLPIRSVMSSAILGCCKL